MKKITLILFCFSFFLLFNVTSEAQLIRFGISAGLTDVTAPSQYTNSIADNGVGFGANLNLGAQARFNLPLVPLTPIVFLNYHMLRGSGTVNTSDIKTSQNIFSIGAEVEYNILPLPFVKPYVSLEAAINHLGDLSNGITNQGSSTRYGGALGIGTVITVLPVVDLDASLKYNMFNLVGKKDGEENINALTFCLAIIF